MNDPVDQVQSIDAIKAAIGQTEKAAQRTAAGAEEGAAASDELFSQATSLKQVMSDLKKLV